MARPKPHKRPEPRIRPSGKGVLIEGIDSYSSWVRTLAGQPPENFAQLVETARDLQPLLHEACGVPVDQDPDQPDDARRLELQKVRDVLLLSAWAITETCNAGDGENPTALVQRLKQVIGWCRPQTSEFTVLALLEHKARELARLIGERLARHEGFILTIFDHGKEDPLLKGHSTWITNLDRNTAIQVLSELVEHVREDQAGRS